MNPRDFLDLADELANGSEEVRWRVASGRAYYAAFHVASRLLTRCGFLVPYGAHAHPYLWMCLSNSGHPDVIQAGLDLNELRRNRTEAEYRIDRPFHHADAILQVESATDVIRTLEEVEATPSVQAQITAVIRVYERDVLQHVTWRPTS